MADLSGHYKPKAALACMSVTQYNDTRSLTMSGIYVIYKLVFSYVATDIEACLWFKGRMVALASEPPVQSLPLMAKQASSLGQRFKHGM